MQNTRQEIDFQTLLTSLPDSEREFGEKLRRHLQFFFMDTLWKWKVRRQVPYKLIFQVLKIVLITAQLILFAELRMSHIDFVDETNLVMRHKFLRKWTDDRDTINYPPSSGKYSVFTVDDLFEEISFIVCSYYHLQENSFASFSYDTSFVENSQPKFNTSMKDGSYNKLPFEKIPFLDFCVKRITNVSVFNNTYEFDINPPVSRLILLKMMSTRYAIIQKVQKVFWKNLV